MKKIAVLSDTHLHEPDDTLRDILDRIKDVDMVIHLGDIVSKSVLDYISERFKTFAVCGNMDPPDLRGELKEKLVLEIENVKIGLIHGYGAPWGIEDRIMGVFRNENVDAIFFGHTHNPTKKKIKNILFFNPGSPTDKLYARENTYGIVTIDGDKINAEIIKV